MAPSTCIRPKKDSRGAHVKLLIGVALFVVTVTKALQPPLDVILQNIISVGWTPGCLVYRTTSCFCFMVYWHWMDLTLVGSSPSTGRCTGTTWKFSSSLACTWPLLSSGRFPSGSPHSSHDSLFLSFHGSEGSSDVVLCTVWSSLSRTPSHLRSAHTCKWMCDFRSNSLGAA